jgi:hypothetical protein
MSYPITLTSDKSEFQNYLSDNIKLAKNSEIALTKASLSVPVKVNQYIQLPDVVVGDTAFTCVVDGIEKNITWTELHAAYTALDAVNGFEPVNINTFYGQNFRLPLNNFIVFEDNNGDYKVRGNINDIIAYALAEKFKFYDIQSIPDMIPNGFTEDYSIGDALEFEGNTYIVHRVMPYEMHLGFGAVYEPSQMAADLNNSVWAAVIGNPTITTVGDGRQIVSTTGNGTGDFDTVAVCNDFIDPNGGWIQLKLDTIPNDTKLAFGLTQSLNQGLSNTLTGYDLENMPIGIEVNKNGTGAIFLQVLDGFHFHDHGTNEENNNNKIPFDQIVQINEDETYFIYFERSNINKSNPFTYQFQVFRNTVNSDFTDPATALIYTSQNSYPNIQKMCPTFMTNQTAVTVNEMQVVPLSDDSLEQLDSTAGGLVAPEQIASISIQPGMDYLDTDLSALGAKFYNDLGFNLSEDVDDSPNKNGFGSNLNNFLYIKKFRRKVNDNFNINVGVNEITKTLKQNTDNGENFLGYVSNTITMPRFIGVQINDMAIKSISGQLVGTQYTTTSLTRIVAQIPVPEEYMNPRESFDLDISYEPYNLIYRQLFNETPIPINQFIIKISYKNFATDKEENIDEINGHLKLELHAQPSSNEIVY